MSPKWRGSTELELQPDLEIEYADGRKTITQRFLGPYQTCVAARPARGQANSSLSGTAIVERVHVRRMSGNRGLMTVVSQDITYNEWAATTGGTYATVEVEQTQEQRSIEAHPRYTEGNDLEGNSIAALDPANLEAKHFALIRQYFDTSDQTAREAIFKADPDTGAETGSLTDFPLAVELLKKKLEGVDSFLHFNAVVRRTTHVRKQTQSGDKGKIFTRSAVRTACDLSDSECPKDPYWIKTADRCTRTGRYGNWELFEEWTGFATVDTDLYLEA